MQESCNSLLLHTSITRKTNKRRNIQNSDNDTNFSQNLDQKLYECLLSLGFKNKSGERSLFFSLKDAQQRKESVSSHREIGTSSFHFPPKEWSIHAVKWAGYIDEKEQTQSQKLNQNIGHATLPGEGHIRCCQWDEDTWWEQHCLHSYKAAGSFLSRWRPLVNIMEFMIGYPKATWKWE